MTRNMVNFGPLAAEIVSLVWGTPVNFNGFRVLAVLLHGTLVVGVSQTLWRWTEGATYIPQGGHHAGHWPTFLVAQSNNDLTSAWCSRRGKHSNHPNRISDEHRSMVHDHIRLFDSESSDYISQCLIVLNKQAPPMQRKRGRPKQPRVKIPTMRTQQHGKQPFTQLRPLKYGWTTLDTCRTTRQPRVAVVIVKRQSFAHAAQNVASSRVWQWTRTVTLHTTQISDISMNYHCCCFVPHLRAISVQLRKIFLMVTKLKGHDRCTRLASCSELSLYKYSQSLIKYR